MQKNETAHIKVWKQQHAHVIKINSETDVAEYAYCKRPTLADIQSYNQVKDADLYKALKQLFEACVLGDLEYDDEFILSAGRSLIQQTILDKEYSINSESGTDEIKKTAALVRHYFKVDPYTLPVNEFYKMLSEALWLQDYNKKQLEQVVAKAMVTTFSHQE